MYPYDFQQISTLEPNFAIKLAKFWGEKKNFFVIKSATPNVSKNIWGRILLL
jgi:hypothetical protein